MGINTRKRMVAALSAVSAIAFIAVPTAVGGDREQLDPWAYNVITEHSAAQGNADVRRPAGLYGALDPWAYRAMHAVATDRVTEHSLGQDPNRRVEPPTFVVTAAAAPGFDWSAAGVGAAATFVLTLMLAAGLLLVKRRGVVHA